MVGNQGQIFQVFLGVPPDPFYPLGQAVLHHPLGLGDQQAP